MIFEADQITLYALVCLFGDPLHPPQQMQNEQIHLWMLCVVGLSAAHFVADVLPERPPIKFTNKLVQKEPWLVSAWSSAAWCFVAAATKLGSQRVQLPGTNTSNIEQVRSQTQAAWWLRGQANAEGSGGARKYTAIVF